MIDIDKYEGHNTDDRVWYEYSRGLTSEHTDGKGRADQADENLVADAPLLLAEVKRLREENQVQWRRLQDLQEEINVLHRGSD